MARQRWWRECIKANLITRFVESVIKKNFRWRFDLREQITAYKRLLCSLNKEITSEKFEWTMKQQYYKLIHGFGIDFDVNTWPSFYVEFQIIDFCFVKHNFLPRFILHEQSLFSLSFFINSTFLGNFLHFFSVWYKKR